MTKFQVFLISGTGWSFSSKNGTFKGQTLVQWKGGGGCSNFGPSVTGHAWRFSKAVFDNNVSNRKRYTYLKGSLKTSSKS